MNQSFIGTIVAAVFATIAYLCARTLVDFVTAKILKSIQARRVRSQIAAAGQSGTTRIRYEGMPEQCGVVLDCAGEFGWLELDRDFSLQDKSFVRLFSKDRTATSRMTELLQAIDRVVGISQIISGRLSKRN